MSELWKLGVLDLARAYAAGETDPVAVLDCLLARIERIDPILNTYARLDPGARAAARESAEALLGGAALLTLADQVAALSWERTAELPPYDERRLDPLTYAAYAGHYEVEPALILEILLVEGRLYAQGEGGEPVALQPVAPAEFLVYGAGLRATFVRNAAGEVTSLTINIEGVETIAPKID